LSWGVTGERERERRRRKKKNDVTPKIITLDWRKMMSPPPLLLHPPLPPCWARHKNPIGQHKNYTTNVKKSFKKRNVSPF
jgi:hypothetical protein